MFQNIEPPRAILSANRNENILYRKAHIADDISAGSILFVCWVTNVCVSLNLGMQPPTVLVRLFINNNNNLAVLNHGIEILRGNRIQINLPGWLG